MKPFPKIFHIGDRSIGKLFEGPVEITEKVDGSQFGIGINKDGGLVFRSKGQELSNNYIDGMFKIAADQAVRIEEILRNNHLLDVYFYFEYLQSPKHNTLCYERIPKNHLYLFGVCFGNDGFVPDSTKLTEIADMLDVERPHVLYNGKINDVKTLEKFLETESILGKEKIEGIVVKNYTQPAFITQDFFFPISMGKYVREEFKERHASNTGSHYTSKDKITILLESLRTEARWSKSIQHLSEKGELKHAPSDIGIIIPEIINDVLEEEESNIKEELFNIYKNDIKRTVTKGFPEFYKKILLGTSF